MDETLVLSIPENSRFFVFYVSRLSEILLLK